MNHKLYFAVTGLLASAISLSSTGNAARRVDPYPDVLLEGEYLFPGQSINADCRTKAVFQTDGNFVVYDKNGVAAWNAHTMGTGNYLYMQDDGNLVVYNYAKQPKWNANTQNVGEYTKVQTDRNLVVYSSYRGAVWDAGTWTTIPPKPSPCVWSTAKTHIYSNWQGSGGDYKSFHPTPAVAERCAAQCAAESQCEFFTYNIAQNNCFLKDGSAPYTQAYVVGMTSGEVLTASN